MQSGQQRDVLFVDGLKIGTTTRLLSATGIIKNDYFCFNLYSNAILGKKRKKNHTFYITPLEILEIWEVDIK